MSGEEAAPVYTLNDDQEIPYATLNKALTRLVAVLDKPLIGREGFPPSKLKREHVDFLVSHTPLIYNYI